MVLIEQDLYFPKGNVSLEFAVGCEPSGDHKLKLKTAERSYTFSAETSSARDEWVKAIRKVIFKSQHEGESVKVGLFLWSLPGRKVSDLYKKMG